MKLYIFILYGIINYLLYFRIIVFNKIVNILFVFPVKGRNGPATLAKSYIHTINIFKKKKILNDKYSMYLRSSITFEYLKKYTEKNDNMIWFLYPDYFELVNNSLYSKLFKNVIYGPVVSPKKWFYFPMKNTYEMKWSNYISKLFGYIVQSVRIKNHLINKSVKLKNIEKKYIISQGCLLSNSSSQIMSWNERKIDILIYAKFVDINKEKELNYLISLLNSTYTLRIIRYGSHSRYSLVNDALNSKILLYYSFFDCWPSSLMEMQNQGVYPIVQQCEFIQKYGKCIKHFDLHPYDIKFAIDIILIKKYNNKIIAEYYINTNNCLNILKKTLLEIYKKKLNMLYKS